MTFEKARIDCCTNITCVGFIEGLIICNDSSNIMNVSETCDLRANCVDGSDEHDCGMFTNIYCIIVSVVIVFALPCLKSSDARGTIFSIKTYFLVLIYKF